MIPKGYKLNPDEKHVKKITESLDNIEKQVGKRYCPCRPIRNDRTVCPCVPFLSDCVCKLYLKE